MITSYLPPPPSLRICDLGPNDRPREKLLRHGPGALSDAEVVALLLNTGGRGVSAVELARRLLATVGNDLHGLARLEVGDLCRVAGIGRAKATRVVAALELGRRRSASFAAHRPVLAESAATFRYLNRQLGDLIYEEFHVLCLNRANELVGSCRISDGGVTSTVADAKRIFRAALAFGTTTSLVLAHNHPSGQAHPSLADIRLTRKICAGARQLDLYVLDHIILAGGTYYSFADEGILYPQEEWSDD